MVGVASLFWLHQSMDSEMQRSLEMPLVVENIPDSITVVGAVPGFVGVSLQAKGYQFVRRKITQHSEVRLQFADGDDGDGYLSYSREKLEAAVRDRIGQGITLLSIRPDSIRAAYTTREGVLMPVVIDGDIRANLQYIVNGDIRIFPDSVRVFSVDRLNEDMRAVSTLPFTATDLRDSTRIHVSLAPIAGARIIPSSVYIEIPVEPLISRRRLVPLKAENLPEHYRLITFPSSVQISYLVAMSRYNEDYPVSVFVDYRDIRPQSRMLPVRIGSFPSVYNSMTVETDSVEFVLENL